MFGARLKMLRKKKGLTQGELGTMIGVSHVQVSRWERLEAAPKFESVQKLARGLNCNVTELLNLSSEVDNEQVKKNLTRTINRQKKTIENLEIELLRIFREYTSLKETKSKSQGNGNLILMLKTLGFDSEDVKKKFREAVHKSHPDKGGTNEAFRSIKEAYDYLKPIF